MWNKLIDHALLKPTLTSTELEEGIQTAIRYDVASVCILPHYVGRCAQALQGTSVQTGSTVSFPHGADATVVKVSEAQQAINKGADELDMVINISKTLSADWIYVRSEIQAVLDVVHASRKKLKVIFENCYLDRAQKIRLCEICAELSVDWTKTSTGFGSSGATLEDVQLMRQHLPSHVQVKAAGGIRDLATLKAFHEAGATRIGTSNTAQILSNVD